jgi:leader peptidase (prepilin peptidase)/N-methyltransferase
MEAALALAAAVVAGLVFGSFLNVCIARLPGHESVVRPRSRCMTCGASIAAYDNIPVLSWLWLRGRCRACRARISAHYPLVELGTAALFVGCVLQTGLEWRTLTHAVACFFLLGLAVMDAQTMLLPDSFTLTGIAAAFILQVAAPGATNRGHIALEVVIATILSAAALLIVWAIYRLIRRREGVGMGDVKLLAMIGAFLGFPLAMFAYFVGVVVASFWVISLVLRGDAVGTDRVPFGSFLALAGIFALFLGQPILNWYLALLHL